VGRGGAPRPLEGRGIGRLGGRETRRGSQVDESVFKTSTVHYGCLPVEVLVGLMECPSLISCGNGGMYLSRGLKMLRAAPPWVRYGAGSNGS
jgi:hypothetical protein